MEEKKNLGRNQAQLGASSPGVYELEAGFTCDFPSSVEHNDFQLFFFRQISLDN